MEKQSNKKCWTSYKNFILSSEELQIPQKKNIIFWIAHIQK